MLILSNKELLLLLALLLQVFYIPTVLLIIIFTILLLKLLLHLQYYYYYCFLVQWTTQMVTILESRCPIFISMKPKITITTTTTLNSYNNKIRQTQLNKYNTTNSTTPTPTRALSRSDYYSDYYYYDHFALTKPSCTPMIIGLLKTTAHSLQRQSTTTTSDDINDENENCTNPTQKIKKKQTKLLSINGLFFISATKISMMIKMMKAKKYLLLIFFQNPQFNLFSSFRLSFSQKNTNLMLDTCTKNLRCLKL